MLETYDMTNKYLEKIAEMTSLSPGISYDHSNGHFAHSQEAFDKINKGYDRENTVKSGLKGAALSTLGAGIGASNFFNKMPSSKFMKRGAPGLAIAGGLAGTLIARHQNSNVAKSPIAQQARAADYIQRKAGHPERSPLQGTNSSSLLRI